MHVIRHPLFGYLTQAGNGWTPRKHDLFCVNVQTARYFKSWIDASAFVEQIQKHFTSTLEIESVGYDAQIRSPDAAGGVCSQKRL